MKDEMMQKWFVVQNGRQIDIHTRVPSEDRELTLVADVRNEEIAKLIAMAPTLKRLVAEARVLMLAEGESTDVEIQFPQHGWLMEVNGLFPMTEDEKLGVANCRR